MRRKFLSPILLLILITCSCSKQQDGYAFITSTPENPSEFIFNFTIDTLTSYDTFISCRFLPDKAYTDFLKLKITVTNPQGNRFFDTAAFPLHSIVSRVSEADGITMYNENRFVDIQWPYRSNVNSDCCGDWSVLIETLNSKKSIYGMGFCYVPTDKAKRNGKR